MSSRSEGEAATLREYLRQISRLPLLTAEEERELGSRIQRDNDEEAFKRVVEANLRFVVHYAKRYRGLGVPFLDLIHEGNLGLMEAARRFDPGRNVRFITYAVWWIRQALSQALSAESRIFALPTRLWPAAARFRRDVALLAAELDRSPTAGEIAEGLEISESDVANLLHVTGGDLSLSLVRGSPGGWGLELGDTLGAGDPGSIEDELINAILLSEFDAVIGELDPREQAVLRLRFGLDGSEPLTLKEAGKRLGLSRERVRQIEIGAREKLRRSQKAQEMRSALN